MLSLSLPGVVLTAANLGRAAGKNCHGGVGFAFCLRCGLVVLEGTGLKELGPCLDIAAV